MTKSTRAVLAANLKTLMAEQPEKLGTHERIAARAGIDTKTVWRTVTTTNAATVDKLDALSSAVGVPPWDLIAPAMNRQRLAESDLRGFEGYLIAMYRAAADDDRRAAIIKAVERVDEPPQPGGEALQTLGMDAVTIATAFDELPKSTPAAVAERRRLAVHLLAQIRNPQPAEPSSPPAPAARPPSPAPRAAQEKRRG